MATKKTNKITSVVAKKDNGNIQITYTIPSDLILTEKAHVLEESAKDMTVPGFRKGKAPIAKVEERIKEGELVEHILNHILPKAFSESIKEHKLQPAIFPKFEAVKIEMGKDFEVRGITCELPEIKLGDYKKKVAGELRAQKLVVPGKEKEAITDEKLIPILLEAVKLDIPEVLVEEEVNGRLSSLLARIEKLGLQLEGYLQTVGKTVEGLREEYKKQSEEAIKLELVLNKIAEEEKVEVGEKEIEEFIKSTGSNLQTVEPQQKQSLVRVLQRRKALEKLASL